MSDYPATTLALNKGKYYVLLTIPKELRKYFGKRTQLKKSTGTTDKAAAKQLQHGITVKLYAQLDAAKPDPLQLVADMLGMSLGEAMELHKDGELEGVILGKMHTPLGGGEIEDDYAIALLREEGKDALETYNYVASLHKGTVPAGAVILSVAAKEYLDTQPYDKHKTARDAELAVQEFQEHVGDLPLAGITAVMVHGFADAIGKEKSRETVSKKVGYVRRLFDFAVRKGWVPFNVFSGLKIDKKIGKARASYRPFSKDELNKLFALTMPSHLRLLLSILVTTGMRLDEAALLDWEDVKTEDGYTFFDLTGVDKVLKTEGSARKVPVPIILHPNVASGKANQMFPQFKRDKDGKAQSPASKALMKLIRQVTDDKAKVVHSLRGNLKDLLRDAGVNKETNDFITGHGSGDVAGKYGSGPSLKVRAEALNKVDHPWLTQEL